MKRPIVFLLIGMLAIVFALLMAVPAMAAPATLADGEEAVTEFFSLEWLATIAGVVAAVTVMVQICKVLVPANINAKIDPKIYCLIWSVIFTIARLLWVVPPTSAADYFGAAINVLLIAVAATGAFEYGLKPIQGVLLKKPGSDTVNNGAGDEPGSGTGSE